MDLRELAPCTFMTMHADIDIDFEPAGTNGYRDLFQDAYRVEVAPGAQPHVVSIEDLDRMQHGAPPQAAAPQPHMRRIPRPLPCSMSRAPHRRLPRRHAALRRRVRPGDLDRGGVPRDPRGPHPVLTARGRRGLRPYSPSSRRYFWRYSSCTSSTLPT